MSISSIRFPGDNEPVFSRFASVMFSSKQTVLSLRSMAKPQNKIENPPKNVNTHSLENMPMLAQQIASKIDNAK